MKNMKKLVLFLAISALIVIGLNAWDDEKLFTTIKGGKGKSNVILIQDHTGSMYTPILHPDFNPNLATSGVNSTNAGYPGDITRTLWYIRWRYTSGSTIYVNNSTIYAMVHDPGGNTINATAEGAFIRVGDYIVQYNPSDAGNRAGQAVARVIAVGNPFVDGDGIKFPLTLNSTTEPRQGDFTAHYYLNVWAENTTITTVYDPATKKIVVGSGGANISVGDYIMSYNTTTPKDLTKQAVGRVTAKSGTSSPYTLTLDNVQGTWSTVNTNYRIYYRRTSTTAAVCLYGTNIGQSTGGYNEVGYSYESAYQPWIFAKATDEQRRQISKLSTLAHDVDYNAYLRTTPVSPLNAYALNMDNSDKTETLVHEWNRVMKEIYPNKVASLKTDVAATGFTIVYEKFKDTLPGYSGGFKIKIDAETMLVSGNDLDAEGKFGTLTIDASGRGYNNTTATAHSSGAAIMIYNDAGLGIDESKPEIHLFSSMQHVDEPTGEVDPDWTETKNIGGTNKTCYRYKRVFTRIQVAREALCDVITARNRLLKMANLASPVTDTDTTLTYYNFDPTFADRIAPFYIRVVDPSDPTDAEIMLVTDKDPVLYTLTVARGLRGTTASAHAADAAIQTYSGTRDLVRFGIFDFPGSDPQGGISATLYFGLPLVPLNDFGQKNTDGTYKTGSYINTTILDAVNGMSADGSTPLAKALALVWNYLKPNANSGTAGTNYIRQTGSSDWQAVNARPTTGTDPGFEMIDGVTHPQGSPMQYWCQENYAVMITDGEATADSDIRNSQYGIFNQPYKKSTLCGSIIDDYFKFNYNLASNSTPWGDIDSYDPTGTFTDYCLNNTCWSSNGTDFLDDVAYFLYHQDMFPTRKINGVTLDPTDKFYKTGAAVADSTLYNETDTDPYKQWPGNQNIKTYTVGLSIKNDLLTETAKNGGGASYTATNYQDLSESFLNIITSVVLAQDPMSYTTYAAPKQSITGGKYGYIAHFVPRERAMWEGHLRRFRLGDDGSFPANIDNPTDTVIVGGTPVVSFKWDAGVILNSRTTARVLYTDVPSGSVWPSTPIDFMSSSIGSAELDVATSAQVTQVKNFIQNFNKSDGINANSDYNNLYRLGETFHFNPQLVGYPLYWKAAFDPSYKSFYEQYGDGGAAPRLEVVYTGANDGKLHCFNAETGAELWSYVPFTLLKQLKEPALNPLLTTSHTYFVDGKSLVKDIKVPKSDGTFYNDYRDWKTALFFGMGIGGRSYVALDITTPSALKVLWETQDSAETVADGHMGFTEGKPVQVDMYGGSTLRYFPGMILAGGYSAAETQATDMSAQEWQRREGKAMYVLNADSGDVIKKFVYGSTSNSSSLNQNPEFLTAMAAAPAVLDKNNDGYADVIYFAESGDYRVPNDHGGAIWKINCYGDPSTWTAQKLYQAPAGQTIYISPSLAYDNDFRVWIMFGTGRRPRPAEGLGTAFTNLAGQFVAFFDDGSTTPITNADLHSANTAVASPTSTDFTIDDGSTVKRGFYFDFLLANEIMWEPQPLYVNSKVYFMTFTPREGTGSSGSTDDPCGGTSAVNGSHYIYQFKLTSQGNTFTIGDFLNQSGKILGYGPMDDKFTIYVGAGDAGNFKSIEGDRINDDMKSAYSTLLWKEDKK
jgi:Tfp pilus tip-associated adhesin PilY1